MLVSDTWMSGDGDPTAGRSGKLTTGNIDCVVISQSIFRTIVGG